MKNNGKIRSNFVKESLLDYNNLANTLKENTSSAVRDILNEAVLEQYAKILNEDEDKDYDVEEVDDTDSVNASEDKDAQDGAEGMESENADEENGSYGLRTEADAPASLRHGQALARIAHCGNARQADTFCRLRGQLLQHSARHDTELRLSHTYSRRQILRGLHRPRSRHGGGRLGTHRLSACAHRVKLR